MILDSVPSGGYGGVLGVVPVLVGPLQALLPVLAGIAVALLGALVSLFKPQVMKQLLHLVWRLKVPVLVAGVVVGGGAWALATYWPYLVGPAAGQAEAGADWPMVRGGPSRRGAAPGADGPTRGGVNWTWTRGGAGYYASPAVVGNRVYVASAALGMFGGSGAILCFDADTGGLVWQGAPEGFRATFSSPSISGRRLVCGEGLHDTRDARVVCLDLAPGREGKVLWTYPTKSHVECAPVIADGRVYIGAGDDGYYCFDLEPGPDGNARVRWHLPGEKYPDAETSLAVHDGKVYAGLGLGGKALCILDADTGEELKRLPTPYPVFSPPAIDGGKLYLGMGNGDYVNSAEEARKKTLERLRAEGKTSAEVEAAKTALGPGGEVWCIDLATREVEWTVKVPRTVLGAVAVAGDALYFGSRDGCLYALDRKGRPLGKWDAHAPIVTSPAVTDEHVYVMTDAGTLYGLARATLEPVWEAAVGTEPLFISSPTVARGRVYVGTEKDGLVCLGQAGGERPTPLWPGHLGGPGAAGNPAGAALPKRGAVQWQYPPDQTGQTQDVTVAAPAAAVGGNLYVPLAGKDRRGLACLPMRGEGGQAPKPVWVAEASNGVYASPAVSGERALFVDGRPGDAQRLLRCVNTADGAVLWQAPVASDASGALAATAENVLVQDAPGVLRCLDLKGKPMWSAPVGTMSRAATAYESMVVAATVEPAGLVALDRPTGRVLWRAALDAAPTTSPAVARNVIYVGTARGLEARSLVDGGPASGWAVACRDPAGDFALERDVLAFITGKGDLVVVKRAGGALVVRQAGAVPGTAPVLSRGAVLYFSDQGIMRLALDEDDARPVLWMETSWLGKPTAPMIVASPHAYVGMAGWGLVCLGAGR